MHVDLVAKDVQDDETSEDDEEDNQDNDSPNAESESLDLDQPQASGVQKSPEVPLEHLKVKCQRKCTSLDSNLKQLTMVTF